jgi:hypothetical protein
VSQHTSLLVRQIGNISFSSKEILPETIMILEQELWAPGEAVLDLALVKMSKSSKQTAMKKSVG